MSQTAVHQSHCCVYHGCKYGDDDCPVYTGEVIQLYECEFCGTDEQLKIIEFLNDEMTQAGPANLEMLAMLARITAFVRSTIRGDLYK